MASFPPIADLSILSIQGACRRLWPDACFLLVLSGELQVEAEERVTALTAGGIALLEPDTPFALRAQGSNLVLNLRMEGDFYARARTGRGPGRMICNSAEDSVHDFSLLRQLLSHLAMTCFEGGAGGELRRMELCYALLFHLGETFFASGTRDPAGEEDAAGRVRRLMALLESRYTRDLKLEDLAREVYLSPAYLSRLIRRVTGRSFRDCLQEVRLRHAVEALRDTEQTITTVAGTCGFPNVSALNAAVRRIYGVTPSQLRDSLRGSEEEARTPDPCREVPFEAIRSELQGMAGPEPPRTLGLYRHPERQTVEIPDGNRGKSLTPIWKKLMNVGTVQSLAGTGMEEQLRLLQREIGVEYARVECVLEEEAIPSLGEGKYNFSRFDRVIGMLRSAGLIPFLDLSLRGNYLFLSGFQVVHRSRRPRREISGRDFAERVSALMRHCINTYGAAEVTRWRVEIGLHHDEVLTPLESPEEYAQRFLAVWRMLKGWVPEMAVGGPGYNIAMEPEFTERIMVLLRREGVCFDFLTVVALPYTPTRLENSSVRFVISSHPDHIPDWVRDFRMTSLQLLQRPVPVWVTVLGCDVRARNPVTDSCFSAAFLVRNTIALIGLADANPLLVEKRDGLMLTANGVNTFHLTLCNYAHFREDYCLTGGEGITWENAYTVFRDAATRSLQVKLGRLAPGRYRITTVTINREHGSLFDSWIRYGILDDLRPGDIRYLQNTVHPHQSVRYLDCGEEGTLVLEVQMLPHEVKCITLTREL